MELDAADAVAHVHQRRACILLHHSIAAPAALFAGLSTLLSLKLTLAGYNTAIPLETYQATMYVVILMSVIFGFLLLGGATALLTSFYPESVAALRAANRRLLGLDAAAALLAAIGIGLFLHQVPALLTDRFHALALFSIDSPDLIVTTAPALVALANAVRSTIMYAALLGAIALILRRLTKEWMKLAAGLVAVFALLPLGMRTPGELALQYGIALMTMASAVLFCARFARRNYLAYALVLWVLSLRGPLGELFGNPIPALHAQGWIVVAVLATSVVWALYPATTRKSETV